MLFVSPSVTFADVAGAESVSRDIIEQALAEARHRGLITLEEHQQIIAAEVNPEREALYRHHAPRLPLRLGGMGENRWLPGTVRAGGFSQL